MQYRCILADPPWQMPLSGKRKSKKAPNGHGNRALPYPTMPLDQICALPVADLATEDCHLWLWTVNGMLDAGFTVMHAWGFRYLAPIHWIKPSGIGNYFAHRTQTLLFGYRRRCLFPLKRYAGNVIITGDPARHSQKPDESYRYIEAISPGPRLELFARRQLPGWDVWGNEVTPTLTLPNPALCLPHAPASMDPALHTTATRPPL